MTAKLNLVDRMKDATNNAIGGVGHSIDGMTGVELKAYPVKSAFANACGVNAGDVWNKSFIPVLKEMGTIDIQALRIVSIDERIAVKRNSDTKFLNWLESRKYFPEITDYQFRILEEEIVSQYADVVNMDRTTLFPRKDIKFTDRYNTLTTVGNVVGSSWLAQNIASRQRRVNLMERLIDNQLVRIRKQMNKMLMNNTEQVVETADRVPQLGGFYTRSTLNAVDLANANISHTALQGAVNTIEATLGVNHQYLFWCRRGQIPVGRDLMINMYPGETSATHRALMDDLMRETLAEFRIPTQVVWEGFPGGSIPIIFEDELPVNTALLHVADLPSMPRFQLDGRTGPYVVARPEPESAFFDLAAVFDIFSLNDPLKVTRVPFTSVGTNGT